MLFLFDGQYGIKCYYYWRYQVLLGGLFNYTSLENLCSQNVTEAKTVVDNNCVLNSKTIQYLNNWLVQSQCNLYHVIIYQLGHWFTDADYCGSSVGRVLWIRVRTMVGLSTLENR